MENDGRGKKGLEEGKGVWAWVREGAREEDGVPESGGGADPAAFRH